jgi:hypothetical protein
MNSSQTWLFVEPQAKRPVSPLTAWMFLLRAQPLLKVFGGRRVQMILRRGGAVLAARLEFLAIPIFSLLLFAVFVGVWSRRRPDVPRRHRARDFGRPSGLTSALLDPWPAVILPGHRHESCQDKPEDYAE